MSNPAGGPNLPPPQQHIVDYICINWILT
jgi:hypothetical protein